MFVRGCRLICVCGFVAIVLRVKTCGMLVRPVYSARLCHFAGRLPSVLATSLLLCQCYYMGQLSVGG